MPQQCFGFVFGGRYLYDSFERDFVLLFYGLRFASLGDDHDTRARRDLYTPLMSVDATRLLFVLFNAEKAWRCGRHQAPHYVCSASVFVRGHCFVACSVR